jgi:hypothetical protein
MFHSKALETSVVSADYIRPKSAASTMTGPIAVKGALSLTTSVQAQVAVAGNVTAPGTGGATYGALPAPYAALSGFSFAAAAANAVNFSVSLPRGWKVGDAITPYVRFLLPTAADAEVVHWQLVYSVAGSGAAVTAPATADVSFSTTGVAAVTIATATFAPIALTAVTALPCVLLCQLSRVVSGDTYTGAALLIDAGANVGVDKLGL